MTTNNLSAAAAKNELHELDEERLRDQKPSANATQSLNEMQHLLDELQARQSELERQNAALQAAAETGQRFTELYELAPVAYFSIDPDSTIRLLNGAGARLLAIDRTQLSAQRLAAHIANDSLPDFNTFLHRAFSSGDNESCELRLIAQGAPPRCRCAPRCGMRQAVVYLQPECHRHQCAQTSGAPVAREHGRPQPGAGFGAHRQLAPDRPKQ